MGDLDQADPDHSRCDQPQREPPPGGERVRRRRQPADHHARAAEVDGDRAVQTEPAVAASRRNHQSQADSKQDPTEDGRVEPRRGFGEAESIDESLRVDQEKGTEDEIDQCIDEEERAAQRAIYRAPSCMEPASSTRISIAVSTSPTRAVIVPLAGRSAGSSSRASA